MAKKTVIATIANVERILAELKAEAEKNPNIEAKYEKKLVIAADALSLKDGVTKDLNQAYTYGKNWWSTNVTDGNIDGCTMQNRLEKIKEHVLKSSAYSRHFNTESTKEKVENWLEENFSVPAEQQIAA